MLDSGCTGDCSRETIHGAIEIVEVRIIESVSGDLVEELPDKDLGKNSLVDKASGPEEVRERKE